MQLEDTRSLLRRIALTDNAFRYNDKKVSFYSIFLVGKYFQFAHFPRVTPDVTQLTFSLSATSYDFYGADLIDLLLESLAYRFNLHTATVIRIFSTQLM